MFTKKFSLETAYASGARIVLNYFSFFFISVIVGGLACAGVLIFLGIIDAFALRYHMAPLLKFLNYVASSATGAVYYHGTTVQEHLRTLLSSEISQQTLGKDIVAIDVTHYDISYVLSVLAPTMIVLKLVIDTISIGWTKIALELTSNKPVTVRYLFSFYHLTPRVALVNLIVGLATMASVMLVLVANAMFGFLGILTVVAFIPSVIIYQRLRFAKYFIIDKNLSIVKSLQASWALTEDATLQLFGFSIVSMLIESIGNAFVVTVLFFMPLHFQVEANVYRQMLDAK